MERIYQPLRFLFFLLVVRPLVLLGLGLNVRHPERLRNVQPPAILVANHNSHLDTLVLMTLLPWRLLPRLRPAAAADYFLRNRLLAWFARHIIGILPVERGGAQRGEDPLAEVSKALDKGDIVLLFPEGTRGEPERLSRLRSGVAYLSQAYPEVEVLPVFLHGLGKALPKGSWLPVPFFCDVFVGEPFSWAGTGSKEEFMSTLETRMDELASQGRFPEWS